MPMLRKLKVLDLDLWQFRWLFVSSSVEEAAECGAGWTDHGGMKRCKHKQVNELPAVLQSSTRQRALLACVSAALKLQRGFREERLGKKDVDGRRLASP